MVRSLDEQLDALQLAVALCHGRLDSPQIEETQALINHVNERATFGFETTVVAFAGGTGAGKSSLVNAVLDAELARVAAIRPTTRSTLGIASDNAAGALLDYLNVYERAVVPNMAVLFPSLAARGRHSRARRLVVLDLPDIDSDVAENRDIAQRLAQKVDVLVWVLDPQKYADAVVHEKYFQTMQAVAGTSVVAMNHIDTVSHEQRDHVLAHLAMILSSDGYHAPVIATSARTGEGVGELRRNIDAIVASKSAMVDRCEGDMQAQAQKLQRFVLSEGGNEPPKHEPAFGATAEKLANALGADQIAQAAADSYKLRGRNATSWPLLRLLRSAKVDPLKRLHLLDSLSSPSASRDMIKAEDLVTPVAATGVTATPADSETARTAIGVYFREVTAHMPRSWAMRAREELSEHGSHYFADADRIWQQHTDIYRKHPLWWRFVNLIHWIALLSALAGGVWLLLWNFADLLKLYIPQPPAWGIFPLPTMLLVVGILVGWILCAITLPLISAGSAQTHKRVKAKLVRAAHDHATRMIVVPARKERERYRQFWEALDTASRG